MSYNTSSVNNFGFHMSNGLITGLTILTFGIISVPYLSGILDLKLQHIKTKYALEIKEIDNNINVRELINYHDKLISHYWKYANFVFITSITGITIFAYKNIIKKN